MARVATRDALQHRLKLARAAPCQRRVVGCSAPAAAALASTARILSPSATSSGVLPACGTAGAQRAALSSQARSRTAAAEEPASRHHTHLVPQANICAKLQQHRHVLLKIGSLRSAMQRSIAILRATYAPAAAGRGSHNSAINSMAVCRGAPPRARCRRHSGAQRTLSLAFTSASAPRSASSFTTEAPSPAYDSAAKCNSVLPYCPSSVVGAAWTSQPSQRINTKVVATAKSRTTVSFAAMLAPRSSSRFTTGTFPRFAATCSGVRPYCANMRGHGHVSTQRQRNRHGSARKVWQMGAVLQKRRPGTVQLNNARAPALAADQFAVRAGTLRACRTVSFASLLAPWSSSNVARSTSREAAAQCNGVWSLP